MDEEARRKAIAGGLDDLSEAMKDLEMEMWMMKGDMAWIAKGGKEIARISSSLLKESYVVEDKARKIAEIVSSISRFCCHIEDS